MRILLAAGLGVALTAPLAAAPTEPAAPPPATGAPAPGPTGDPRVERQRNTAAKLAGMVRFVDASCPEAKPDYERFRSAIAGLGVDIKELENGELMIRSLRYTEAYQKEPAESCRRALQHFGEDGTTMRGLIGKKAP